MPGPKARLLQDLLVNGYSFEKAIYLVDEKIPLDLALAYANYLPQTEQQARFPVDHDISKYHWAEFAKYGLPPSPFGGTPFGGSEVLSPMWCPMCQDPFN